MIVVVVRDLGNVGRGQRVQGGGAPFVKEPGKSGPRTHVVRPVGVGGDGETDGQRCDGTPREEHHAEPPPAPIGGAHQESQRSSPRQRKSERASSAPIAGWRNKATITSRCQLKRAVRWTSAWTSLEAATSIIRSISVSVSCASRPRSQSATRISCPRRSFQARS